MIRTTPRRRTTLHLSQIRLTDALTFIVCSFAALRREAWSLWPGPNPIELLERFALLEPLALPCDPPARLVAPAQLDRHPVPHHQSDEIPSGSRPRMRDHLVPVAQSHPIERPGQDRDDGAGHRLVAAFSSVALGRHRTDCRRVTSGFSPARPSSAH